MSSTARRLSLTDDDDVEYDARKSEIAQTLALNVESASDAIDSHNTDNNENSSMLDHRILQITKDKFNERFSKRAMLLAGGIIITILIIVGIIIGATTSVTPDKTISSSSSSSSTGGFSSSSSSSSFASSSSMINNNAPIVFLNVFNDSSCRFPFTIDQSWRQYSSLSSSSVSTVNGSLDSFTGPSCVQNPLTNFIAGSFFCINGQRQNSPIAEIYGSLYLIDNTCDSNRNDSSYNFANITKNINTENSCTSGGATINRTNYIVYANWKCNYNMSMPFPLSSSSSSTGLNFSSSSSSSLSSSLFNYSSSSSIPSSSSSSIYSSSSLDSSSSSSSSAAPSSSSSSSSSESSSSSIASSSSSSAPSSSSSTSG